MMTSVDATVRWSRGSLLHSASTVSQTSSIDMQSSEQAPSSSTTIGSIVFLVPSGNISSLTTKFGSKSPVGSPTILDAVQHLSRKAFYFSDGQVETAILPAGFEGKPNLLQEANILIALGLQSSDDLQFAESVFTDRAAHKISSSVRSSEQCQFALDCAPSDVLDQTTFVGPYLVSKPSFTSRFLPWTKAASARRMYDQMSDLFTRWSSDEFTTACMLFLNQFSGYSVDWVKHSIDATWEKGPLRNLQEFMAMVTKCGDCIGNCVRDETCRTCITKLTKIDPRDQVLNYRTIVSYESDLLRDFSLCILTKNNIFNCDAKIPQLPAVQPMTHWQGQPLTEEMGRSLLVGHLDDDAAPPIIGQAKLNMSWKVACGANVAYDQFPSQNQLFYPAARGRDMWYDPIFRVVTLDGRNIWCKRYVGWTKAVAIRLNS